MPMVITTAVTFGSNVTILEVGGKWTGLEGKVLGWWWWQTMKRSGANFGLFQCLQEALDPENGTELETLETELAREDEEEGGPTMGPHFRAAEQSWDTEFQIFPVSLGGLGAGTPSWSHTWPHSLFGFL